MSVIINSYVELVAGSLNSLAGLAGGALGSAATAVGTGWDGVLAIFGTVTGSLG